MEVYLDNSATTCPFDEVCGYMDELNRTCWGNPSSLHTLGMQAEAAVSEARSALLGGLGNADGNIVFTSGGTEANNLAILGTVMAKLKRHPKIITTKIEHPAVSEPFRYLEQQGAEAVYLDVDARGQVDMAQLRDALDADTALVSIMHVNNEVGSVQPIRAIAALVHRTAPRCVFHVDGVQAYGKVDVDVSGVDMYTISSHKINGPKGVGALYVRRGVSLKPAVYGGHQERGLRSGTENVAGIGGFGRAAQITLRDRAAHAAHMASLKARLADRLADIPGACVNGGLGDGFAPHILNVSFPGIRSEVLLHALERHGVYVSAGSACSSNRPSLSPVLSAMGLDRVRIDSALRFSLGYGVDEAGIDYAADCVRQEAAALRI